MAPTTKPNAKLLELWRKLTPAKRKVFATAAESSPGSMRQYAEGRRGISALLAIRIEKATRALRTNPRLDRTELSEACRGCEYAKACKKHGLTL